ncbi:MAG: hypothetical protein ACPGRC_07925 [Salibacteraceae bacterium]
MNQSKSGEASINFQHEITGITLFVVNALFFIDEGYYSFYWMLNWGNWVVFIIYFGVLYVIQTLLIMVFKRFEITSNYYLVSLLGLVFGLVLLFTIMSK